MEEKRIVPVILVTGFLGSGKTTLLNKIIAENPEKKISLILNEFGEIKLESQFIEKEGVQVAELANGCMCCLAKTDIPRVIELVLSQTELDWVVIEASGLSDPDPIHQVMEEERLVSRIRLSRVVAVVDAVNFEKTRQEHQIVMSQVADADTVVVSKVNEAGRKEAQRIAGALKKLTLNTEIYLWDEEFTTQLLLAEPGEVKQVEDEVEHKHEQYDELWFRSEKMIDRTRFETAMRKLPRLVVRAKGYVNCAGNKYLVQYTMGKLKLLPDEWGEEQPATAILMLGKELPKEEITNLLQSAT